MTVFKQRVDMRAVLQSRSTAILAVLFLPAIFVGLLMSIKFNAFLAVAAAISLCVAVYMFAKPTATTIVVIFALYANLMIVAIRSYGVPELLAGSFFLLLGLPFLNYTLIRGKPIITNRIMLIMVLYLGVMLISAAVSTNMDLATERIISFVAEGIALYFLIINTVRTPKMLQRVIWTLIAAGILMGSLSLYQEITKSYDNDFGGLAVVKDSEISTGELDADGNKIKRQRLSGPVGSKNRYAQIMVVLFPLALFRFWSEKSLLLRLLGVAACIPIISGAFLTFSRGAGLSIILILIIMVVLRMIKIQHFILIGLFAIAITLVAIPDYVYRISRTSGVVDLAQGNEAEAGGSVRGRATVNLATFNIFLDHPFLGVGPGQTRLYTTEYGNAVGYRFLTGNQTRRAHNMFLEELADTGIFGFAIFMSMVLYPLWRLFWLRRYWLKRNLEVGYTISAIMLAIFAYLSTAVFLHLSYMRYYYAILAIAGAAIEIYSNPVYKQRLKLVGKMKPAVETSS